MPTRLVLLMLVIAVALTALSYVYKKDSSQFLKEPGQADLIREETVHGWPWGYYARVSEHVVEEGYHVQFFPWTEIRWAALVQTFAIWFFVALVSVIGVIMWLSGQESADASS